MSDRLRVKLLPVAREICANIWRNNYTVAALSFTPGLRERIINNYLSGKNDEDSYLTATLETLIKTFQENEAFSIKEKEGVIKCA